MIKNHLLIIEDEYSFGSLLAQKFIALGWDVTHLCSIKETFQNISEFHKFSHCILDLNLSQHSGLAIIQPLLKHSPLCKIVVLTGYASVQTTIEAIKLGAIYLLSKPSSIHDILKAFDHLADPEQVRMDAYARRGIEQTEWEMIQKALVNNQFNISKTAEQLGMHRRTLQRKLRKKM